MEKKKKTLGPSWGYYSYKSQKKKRTLTNKKANKSKSSDAKMSTKQFVFEGFQEA